MRDEVRRISKDLLFPSMSLPGALPSPLRDWLPAQGPGAKGKTRTAKTEMETIFLTLHLQRLYSGHTSKVYTVHQFPGLPTS